MFIIRSICSLTKQSTLCPTFPTFKTLQMFSFATKKWNRRQFLKKLDRQIMDSHAKICWENPTAEAYFTKKHWKIRYIEEKTIFEYSKIVGEHEIRILTYVMYAPPNDPDHAEFVQSQKNDSNSKPNQAQVAIYMRKIGSQKWLTIEMGVLEGSIDLLGVFFTNLQPNLTWEKNTYPGPEIRTLPKVILNGINTTLAEFGLTNEVIMNMVIHASIKVDPLDLQWLKNLRDIWI